jgi:hypothetical protein
MSSAPYASHPSAVPATTEPGQDSGSSFFWAAVSILLGILVAVFGILAVLMWADARGARNDANRALAKVASGATANAQSMAATSSALESYAGAAPANADALAAMHKPYSAALPAAPPGPVVNANLVLKDITVQIAPGVKYAAWAWAGGATRSARTIRACSCTTAGRSRS